MNREKQLIKNTMILAIGQICTKFVSFFLLPLYTYLLSPEEYGIVDLLNTFISLMIPLFFFQMNQAVFRFLIDARNDELEKKRLISTSIIILLVQSMLYSIIFILFSFMINNSYKYFLLTNVIVIMFANYFLQISRGLGDNILYSIGSLITGVGTIILNIVFIVIFNLGAYGILISTLIANVFCILFIFIKKKLYKYISINSYKKEKRNELWKYSIPLIPNQLSWWVINASDRTIISFMLNISMNGIYSAANKFSAIIITFFNIFNTTWSESASLHIKDKDCSEFFSNIFNASLKLFISICLLTISTMPFIFKFLITGQAYSSAYYQIPILLLSTVFNITVSLLGSIYVALKKSKEIAKTSIYSAIINIVINILLIKYIGLYAASISTLVAFASLTIYRFIDVQKFVKIDIDKKTILGSILMIAIILPTYYFKNFYVSIFGLIVTLCFSYYNNKQMLNKFIFILKWKTKSICKKFI